MKKVEASDRDTLRAEYRREDLGKGIRGKYFKQFAGGTNLVLLSPDVARAFPTTESVNSALRSLLQVAERAAAAKKLPQRGRRQAARG
jgi:hypothetical protein